MSLNRTVADLMVKSVTVTTWNGSRWITPPEKYFVSGARYRLKFYFGNTGPKVKWADQQYRKENVDIRVVPMGFHYKKQYYDKTKITFYTDSTFSKQVQNPKYRTSHHLPIFETHNADVAFCSYFKPSSGIRRWPIRKFRWDMGIYASVRNRKWRKLFTKV